MIQQIGRFGVYSGDGDVIAFSIDGLDDPVFSSAPARSAGRKSDSYRRVGDFRLLCRGVDDRSCEEIEGALKANRLMPSLISKQVRLLYGRGPRIYLRSGEDGEDGVNKNWVAQEQIQSWLESWQENGLDMSYTDFAAACIKSYYFFRDYFVKWRMSLSPGVGGAPHVAGLEFVDNRFCRLATTKKESDRTPTSYSDFSVVVFGDFRQSSNTYKIYPLLRLKEVDKYKFAAISHHRESSPGEVYGLNEVYEGIKEFLKTSNELPIYVGSFLENALAAKVHVVIPNAWVEAKRAQIKTICKENEKRVKANLSPVAFEGVDVGTEYKESDLSTLIQNQLRQISRFLSGSRNQGKAFSSYSFMDSSGNEQRWKIEEIDLKYKEYIEALDSHDKRIDEVLVSSVGLDPSISSISKPGMISKSGADTYYNLLLYLMTLTLDDEKCCEPFNLAIQINFPDLYKEGYRVGFFRPLPAKQSRKSTIQSSLRIMDIQTLFPDLAALRLYAPGISAGNSLHDLQGMLPHAEKQVAGIVGRQLLDKLLTAAETTREGGAIRSAFANLLLLKTITFDSVNKRLTGEKDLYRYEVDAMRREYTDNYYNAMDTILSVVSSEAEYATLWEGSRWASLLKNVRIVSCSDFDSLYPIDLSYLFFFRTLPFQREALLEHGAVFERLEEKEAEDPAIVNYEALTLQARLALAKLVVALALERLDVTELPAVIRNLFVEQKTLRTGYDPATATAAMASRLRSEASVALSTVSIALSDTPNAGGSGIRATAEDKIILMP